MNTTRKLALTIATASLLAAASGASAQTTGGLCDSPRAPKEVFDCLKRLEASFPVPEPRARGTIGTFDIASGDFSGKRTTYRYIEGRKPPRVAIVPSLHVNGVHAVVGFRFTNPTGGLVTVSANGVTRRLRRRAVVSIAVGRARSVDWTISSGGATLRDRVNIIRPRMVGAGAFTIEALPVTVLYEPPQPADPERHNTATYSDSSSLGTRITAALSRSTSTTSAGPTPGFADSESLRKSAGALAAGVIKAGNAAGDSGLEYSGKALAAFSRALGSAERTGTDVDATVDNNALELRLTKMRSCETREHLGPGRGDLIVYLKTVRVAWMDDGSQTTLTVLGADRIACKSARELAATLGGRRIDGAPRPTAPCLTAMARPGARSVPRRSCRRGLSPTTVRALLAQDPFVAGGPDVALSPERFERTTGIEIPELGGYREATATTVSADDERVTTRSSITTDRTSKSLLSFAGIGPDETKEVTTTVTAMSATTFRRERTVATMLVLDGIPAGADGFDVFYDRLYGTFALKATSG